MTERHILSLDHSFEGDVRDVADALFVAAKEVTPEQMHKLGINEHHIRFVILFCSASFRYFLSSVILKIHITRFVRSWFWYNNGNIPLGVKSDGCLP